MVTQATEAAIKKLSDVGIQIFGGRADINMIIKGGFPRAHEEGLNQAAILLIWTMPGSAVTKFIFSQLVLAAILEGNVIASSVCAGGMAVGFL